MLLLIALVAALWGLPQGRVCAVPACPTPFAVEQPDGSEVMVQLRGDEFMHWHEDRAGFTVLQDPASRRWVYAQRDEDGSLRPGPWAVGRVDPASLGIERRALPHAAQRPAPQPRHPPGKAPLSRALGALGTPGVGAAGAPELASAAVLSNLVVLVAFSDLAPTYTRQEFDDLFNTIGYAADGAAGSVRDYYDEVSYANLEVRSIVADWVTLDNGYAYYGGDNAFGSDQRPREMVSEALAKLEARGFDFSMADADNDGDVDGLTIIHAGGGEEYGGNDTDYIWSHQWYMISSVTYDGTTMWPYHTEPERRGWDSTPSTWGITRIGVICHETGHFLGLPDLYDYDYDSRGVGDFCLMAGGSWNGSYGTTPAHMSAWCKKDLGWVTPTTVTGSGVYTVPRAEDSATAFQLQGPFPSDEYFLVENRQGIGFDAGLPGSTRGLLVWHIDEGQPDNDDQTHFMVDLEEASGTQHLELDMNSGEDSDYYRQGNNTAFTATSTPNNESYAGTPLGLDIVSVSASGATMTFEIGSLPVDHFDWDAISSPQTVDTPFVTTVRARDVFGQTVSNFTGTVGLSGWLQGPSDATLVITECDPGFPDYVEIQNVSGGELDTAGWVLAVSANYSDINSVNPTYWYLSNSTPAGTVLYRTDTSSDNYWGANIFWNPGNQSWAMIVDDVGDLVDLAVWGWDAGSIASMAPVVNGHTISVGSGFSGGGSSSSGTGTIQRAGSEDTNTEADFAWVSPGSKGTQNSGMTVPFIGVGAEVSIAPTVTASFVAGVWSGAVTVQEVASNMFLLADDGGGNTGRSGVFDATASTTASNASLVVTSAYGMSAPPVGTNVLTLGSSVTCLVTNSPVMLVDVESVITAVCTGWTGSGSVPATGSSTNTGVFSLTNDSSITWHWAIKDLVLSNQVESASTNYRALDTITAEEGYEVRTPGRVTFRAGQTIRLGPGFTARTGSVFRATIE